MNTNHEKTIEELKSLQKKERLTFWYGTQISEVADGDESVRKLRDVVNMLVDNKAITVMQRRDDSEGYNKAKFEYIAVGL